MVAVNLFGPVDATLGAEVVEGVLAIEALLFALVLVNLLTRRLAYGRHRRQAEEGPEAVSRWPVHEFTNVALVVGSLYYLTLSHHAGMVLSTLTIGLFLTDFFEFEARKVEARREIPLERPKGAVVASLLVLAYAAYQTLFVFAEPFWASVL